MSLERRAKQVYEDVESRTADAWEEVVRRESFGEILARVTENAMGVMRISNEGFDLLVRNLRLAGRRDIARLGAQLARTEDKLEMVLQEVELLREELAEQRASTAEDGGGSGRRRSANGRSQTGSRASAKGS